MIQQSNCFLVVERGVGMQNLMQERALQKAGELRQDSNVGGGQMVTADYVLTPAVVFSEDNAGGVGGGVGAAIGGLFGSGGRAIGAVAGGLKFKEAQTSMLVADARSSIQVAAAEGSARKADFRLGGLFAGGGVAAGLGGYRTPTKVRSSRPASPTTTTASSGRCAAIRACSARSPRSQAPRRVPRPRPAASSAKVTSCARRSPT